jgi:hypothetical protein
MPDALPPRIRTLPPALAVVALVLLAQLPLVLNPGYFSHDELQWAARADAGDAFPWLGLEAFQYRPLTFNLWLWLSKALFATPWAFHLVVVALGALNAALLAVVLRRFGAPAVASAVAALVFALGPCAAYVHGWVATLGDLLWVGCALLCAWTATRTRPAWGLAGLALLLTVPGLLAKEAALSIPALAAVALLLDAPRRQRWLAVLAGSAIPALAYVALRHRVLSDIAPQDAAYAWELAHMPRRWLEYQLYPPNLPVFEAHTTLSRGFDTRTGVAALLWLALAAALARAHWRWAAAFVLGGIAALGPVLVLGNAGNQYAYGFSALTAGVVALAWPRLPRWGRAVAWLLALLLVLHGLSVMRQVRRVGEVQAVFSPALAAAVAGAAPGSVLRLAPAAEAAPWMFQRLAHDIPSYRGVAIGSRARVVEAGAPSDYVIEADGRLRRIETPSP